MKLYTVNALGMRCITAELIENQMGFAELRAELQERAARFYAGDVENSLDRGNGPTCEIGKHASLDGNKRTSRFMMNGVLMSHGIDAISVPAAKAQEFNEKMVRFYLSKDATEMMAFLAGCHPDAEAILPPPYEDRNHDSGIEP